MIGIFVIVGILAIVLGPARATVDLGKWFTRATAYQSSGSATGTAMAKADFLGGTSYESVCHIGALKTNAQPIIFNNFWQLMRYDRKHHIALAAGSTDQCSGALFVAPPPGVDVPDQDLSAYATGRGLHLGSTYETVRSLYGGTAKSGSHFVVEYAASSWALSITKKRVELPEIITIVVDNDRVSAITVYIDTGAMY